MGQHGSAWVNMGQHLVLAEILNVYTAPPPHPRSPAPARPFTSQVSGLISRTVFFMEYDIALFLLHIILTLESVKKLCEYIF